MPPAIATSSTEHTNEDFVSDWYGYTRYLYEFYSILFSSILFLFCVVFVTVLVLVTVAVIRIVTVFVIILVMTSVLPILVLVILILNAIPILLIQVLVLSFKSYCILILFNSVLFQTAISSSFSIESTEMSYIQLCKRTPRIRWDTSGLNDVMRTLSC